MKILQSIHQLSVGLDIQIHATKAWHLFQAICNAWSCSGGHCGVTKYCGADTLAVIVVTWWLKRPYLEPSFLSGHRFEKCPRSFLTITSMILESTVEADTLIQTLILRVYTYRSRWHDDWRGPIWGAFASIRLQIREMSKFKILDHPINDHRQLCRMGQFTSGECEDTPDSLVLH